MLNVNSEDLTNPESPTAEMLNAWTILRMLIESGEGDADPVAMLDAASRSIEQARLLYQKRRLA